jgi:O-acetyl-ADP-ribose deacetylase (regulator of RNase III)
MKIIQGDLLQCIARGTFDVVFHGCNCFNTMGGGIARAISRRYPEVARVDMETSRGDPAKLGTYTSAKVATLSGTCEILNAYTQFNLSSGGDVFEYGYFKIFLKTIKPLIEDKRIGYPAIGAGLACGDWPRIYAIICEELNGFDHTLVLLEDSFDRKGSI